MKYKGIDLITGQWVYGFIFKHGDQRFILQRNGHVNEVKPESIVEVSAYDWDTYLQYIVS